MRLDWSTYDKSNQNEIKQVFIGYSLMAKIPPFPPHKDPNGVEELDLQQRSNRVIPQGQICFIT